VTGWDGWYRSNGEETKVPTSDDTIELATSAECRVTASANRPEPVEGRRPTLRTAVFFLFVPLPIVLNVAIVWASIRVGFATSFGFDFHAVWEAGRTVLHGHSPYPSATVAALRSENQFVYPPLAAFLFVPLAVLPFKLASLLFCAVLAACVPLTLWVLGVRDWRCYGVTFLSIPVIACLHLGAISLVLALATAILWRCRDNAVVAGLVVAFLIAVKIFLWPFAVWLLVHHRVRSAVLAGGIAAGATGAAWIALGFGGLREYPSLLGTLAHVVQWKSYSLGALALGAGLGSHAARVSEFLVGGLLIAAVALLARRGGSEWTTFVLSIAAAFALSPIVWQHYYVVLLPVLAVARPRLSALWFVPLLFWMTPGQTYGRMWQIVLGVAIFVLVIGFGAGARPIRIRELTARRWPALRPSTASSSG
jgi:Glycosyltransferase family 87